MTKDDLVRSCIIDAARKLFQHFGVSKTTMDDIAKAVGKGKSSLYYYYATKDSIFEEVIKEETNTIANQVLKAIEKESDPEQKLYAFFSAKYKELRKRRLRYRTFVTELENNSSGVSNSCIFSVIKERSNIFEQGTVKKILEEGVDQGVFNEKVRNELDVYTEVCVNTLKGLEFDLLMGTTLNTNRLSALTLSILIAGLK